MMTSPPKLSVDGDRSTGAASDLRTAKASFLGVFLSTFITIFLAELGDKTQVATLLISAQSHKPVTVFIGAAAALIGTSLMGVLLGQWLAQRVSPETLDILAGILLLVISVGLVADVVAL
ncbi:MAG: TMEM165/GDT1 family protein [Cyanobacteria bacterium P01_D01_bin.2]